MDEIRESHLDAEGVLVGNENDSDFEVVEHNELPPEMRRRSTRGRKSSSKKVSQSQSKNSSKSQSKKKKKQNDVPSSEPAGMIDDEEPAAQIPINYEVVQQVEEEK